VKQVLRQNQKISLALTPVLQKQIKLLSLSGQNIREELKELLNEIVEDEEEKSFKNFKDEILIDSYRVFLQGSSDRNNIELVDFQDLRSSLSEQFKLLNLKESDYLIGEYLIDSIEPEGKLDPEIDYEDIKLLIFESFGKKIINNDIENILNKIQKLEPEGCGYRSITESLIAQVKSLSLEQKIKSLTIEALIDISQQKKSIEDLAGKIQKIIKSLSLHPGLKLESEETTFTKPDLLALKKNNEWYVSLNDSYMPKALLEKIKSRINSPNLEDKVEIKSFLKGLEKRQKTLLLVAEYLVKKQTRFLNNKSNLVPITLLEVAKRLELSESTISRIVQSKFMQLPDKLISLNSLLQRRVNSNTEGRDISPMELEGILEKLVALENKKNPHTDESLKNILKVSHSIDIARRTVAKYRKRINLPIARLRKQKY